MTATRYATADEAIEALSAIDPELPGYHITVLETLRTLRLPAKNVVPVVRHFRRSDMPDDVYRVLRESAYRFECSWAPR
jgi:hypothetical protein